MLATVDAGQLFEVAWVSLVAGVFVTAAFSFVVLFSGRSAEARRSGSGGVATLYAGLAFVAMALFLAVVGYGVHIMLSKA
jgi:formate/nitrite transporter FocA (FNT family)